MENYNNIIKKIINKVKWEFFREIGDTKVNPKVKVYIISHPKCGRTWLRVLLGKILCEQYKLDEKDLLNTIRLTVKAGIPGVNWTHEHSGDLGAGSWTGNRFVKFAKDKSIFANKKVIFLIREPKDVMVSFYFHKTKRASKIDFQGSISDFIRSRRLGIQKLINFYNTWHKNQNVPEDFLLLRYEDLHTNTYETVKSVLSFIGLDDIQDRVIYNAIEFASFSNMKKMESSQAIESSILQPGDSQDQNSYKVRKGKVGGYTEHLTEEDIDYIDKVIKKMGCPFLGIEKA